MCIEYLPACMYGHYMHAHKRALATLELWTIDSCDPRCGSWVLNPDSLKKHQVLLTLSHLSNPTQSNSYLGPRNTAWITEGNFMPSSCKGMHAYMPHARVHEVQFFFSKSLIFEHWFLLLNKMIRIVYFLNFSVKMCSQRCSRWCVRSW